MRLKHTVCSCQSRPLVTRRVYRQCGGRPAGVRLPYQALADGGLDIIGKKNELRDLVSSTSRGLGAGVGTRGGVEEAQVALEITQSSIDYNLLEGTWELIYTTAVDVLPILFLGNPQTIAGVTLPTPLSIGRIFQKFSSPDEGTIENIIKYSVAGLLEEEGITTTVLARYQVVNSQRVFLNFEKLQLGEVKISPELESIIAPAMLPRSGFNHQILLALQELAWSIPLSDASAFFPSSREGGNYLLTYLDEDMLIGRASGTRGSFIFNRVMSI